MASGVLGFDKGEQRWREELGTLRQVVRQELVARQLDVHLPSSPFLKVLDVGCGQGTQALRLARRGHSVIGLDSSAALLGDFKRALTKEHIDVQARVRIIQHDARDLAELFDPSNFDVVLCHGVLMYFADPEPLLSDLTKLVTGHGILSLLVRNGDALAMRPGLLGEWASALQAFDGLSYNNRIGVSARADRFEALKSSLADREMTVRAWYGVRVFTDTVEDHATVPDDQVLEILLACEEKAGAIDPYRRIAALTHVIAERVTA